MLLLSEELLVSLLVHLQVWHFHFYCLLVLVAEKGG